MKFDDCEFSAMTSNNKFMVVGQTLRGGKITIIHIGGCLISGFDHQEKVVYALKKYYPRP